MLLIMSSSCTSELEQRAACDINVQTCLSVRMTYVCLIAGYTRLKQCSAFTGIHMHYTCFDHDTLILAYFPRTCQVMSTKRSFHNTITEWSVPINITQKSYNVVQQQCKQQQHKRHSQCLYVGGRILVTEKKKKTNFSSRSHASSEKLQTSEITGA